MSLKYPSAAFASEELVSSPFLFVRSLFVADSNCVQF